MKYHILIGGEAGQGINKISEILSDILTNYGYFTFNYRDYESLVRGGHNFNILTLSDKWIASHQSKVDFLIAMDDLTLKKHKNKLKKDSIVITYKDFQGLGRNLNIALAGALIKIFGIPEKVFFSKIKKEFNNEEATKAAEKGYNSQNEKYYLKKINNKIKILTGSKATAIGAINSDLDLLVLYPMTPATGLANETAGLSSEKSNFFVFQPESEIGGINQALGASFAGAKTMIGTSGGGFDLMTESLSMSGQSEIPIVMNLVSRSGPSTGIPTYTSQGDLDIALRSGHGEFPRIVVAPGDPLECMEKTNELFYLSYKYNVPSIVLTDKHIAESEFSINKKPNKILKPKLNRKIPGKFIIKSSSYEHLNTSKSETTESAEDAKKGNELRLKKYSEIKKEIQKENYEAIKIHGKKRSKNLIISWGSPKGAILDAINSENLDCKFLQVLYLKPLSNKIKTQMKNAKNIILIEQNTTGQLGRLLREKTGIAIKPNNRILKNDGRPFNSDELAKEIKKRLK